MARLKYKNTEPPGGWRFFEVRTKLLIKDTSIELLTKQVIDHRIYKGLTPTDYETVQIEIEHQICARLGTDECTAEGLSDEWVPIDSRVGNQFNFSAIMGFSRAALDWVKNDGEVVSLPELNRRHEICVGCALNNPASGCSACSMFYQTINAIVPAGRKFDDLHVCGACGCALNSKIQLPISAVDASNQGRQISYPKWCWQNVDSPNYLP